MAKIEGTVSVQVHSLLQTSEVMVAVGQFVCCEGQMEVPAGWQQGVFF